MKVGYSNQMRLLTSNQTQSGKAGKVDSGTKMDKSGVEPAFNLKGEKDEKDK